MPPERIVEMIERCLPRVQAEPARHKLFGEGASISELSGARARLEETLQRQSQ